MHLDKNFGLVLSLVMRGIEHILETELHERLSAWKGEICGEKGAVGTSVMYKELLGNLDSCQNLHHQLRVVSMGSSW